MITKDMSITDIIRNYPETIPVFQKYALGCLGCFAAAGETLEAGLNVHGLDIDEVLTDLNKAVEVKG
ncbi:MAG: DUF1858 domain-containing protein [Candidatus Margulisiibacteriota bacterium]